MLPCRAGGFSPIGDGVGETKESGSSVLRVFQQEGFANDREEDETSTKMYTKYTRSSDVYLSRLYTPLSKNALSNFVWRQMSPTMESSIGESPDVKGVKNQ